MKETLELAICQLWEESERGWGCRPDGFSLHLTDEDRLKYIKEYWDRQPDGPAPDEYSRPLGWPMSKGFNVKVTKEVYAKLKERAEHHGIMVWSSWINESAIVKEC